MNRSFTVLVASLIFLSSVSAAATDSENVTLSQERYNELTSEINRLQDRIDDLESDIRSLRDSGEDNTGSNGEGIQEDTEDSLKARNISMSAKQDLGDLPSVFSNKGSDFKVVLGEDPLVTDVAGATDIAGYVNQLSDPRDIVDSSKADEISINGDLNTNYILVGGPRANELTNQLAQRNKTWKRDRYDPGTAIIQYVNDAFVTGYDAIVVAGYSGEDTNRAAEFLAEYRQNSERFENKSKVVLSDTSE